MTKARKILLVIGGLFVVISLIAGVIVYQFLQIFEQIDNTVPHGDQCLAELQGENYRCWDLFVPDDLRDGNVPLVLDFHGYFNSPETHRGYAHFDVLAAEEKFIVVWPYGIDYSWNGGGEPWPEENVPAQIVGEGCCGPALFYGVDDVAFLVRMIERVVEEQPVDETKIYLSGFSTGCFMAQRLASEHSELFAGLACVAGSVLVDADPDYSPLPIMEVRGTEDDTSPYETDYWPGAMDNFEIWKTRNNCKSAAKVVWQQNEHSMVQSSDCQHDATVAQLTIVGAGHVVYKDAIDADGIDITNMMWDFLVENSAD